MFKIAKQRDNGNYAYLGMLYQCATYFNIDMHSECAKYIVDTYLECIQGFDFLEWIRGANPSEKVVVMDRYFLKENFNDLLAVSDDLETLSDLFMYLYEQEIWIDANEDVLYSTVFNLSLKNRTKLDYIGIARTFERLYTIKDKATLNWDDIDTTVNLLAKCGYNIENDYKYRENNVNKTAMNILERLEQIFHFGVYICDKHDDYYYYY